MTVVQVAKKSEEEEDDNTSTACILEEGRVLSDSTTHSGSVSANIKMTTRVSLRSLATAAGFYNEYYPRKHGDLVCSCCYGCCKKVQVDERDVCDFDDWICFCGLFRCNDLGILIVVYLVIPVVLALVGAILLIVMATKSTDEALSTPAVLGLVVMMVPLMIVVLCCVAEQTCPYSDTASSVHRPCSDAGTPKPAKMART